MNVRVFDGMSCVIECAKHGQSQNLGNAGLEGSLLSAVTSLPIRTVMSGEPEDSKPKLNLVISHSGTRTSSLVRYCR